MGKYVGTEYISKVGRRAVVVTYKPHDKVTGKGARVVIRFDDGVEKEMTASCLRSYGVTHPDEEQKPAYCVGDTVTSNQFGDAVVTSYINNKSVDVVFTDGRVGTRLQSDALRKGEFAPDNALRTKDLSAWLEKSIAAHGEGRYDYSRVVFGKANSVVEIGCNKCGMWFRSTLSDHHNKNYVGCPACARKAAAEKSRMPVEDFIDKAGAAHNWKYTYNLKSYTGSTNPVTVICPIHGEYSCGAGNHANGGGHCPSCARIKSLQDKFKSLPALHGYKYLTYTEDGKVWMQHEKCGEIFSTKMSNVTPERKFLCGKCGIQNVTFDVFKERAEKIHGDAYEYSDWIDINSPLTFKHKSCGNTFVAHTGSHITGNYGKGVGCPFCAKHGFSVGRNSHLYVLQAPNGYVKVGITHQGVDGRLRQISKSTKKIGWVFSEVASWELPGVDAKRIEALAHNELKKKYKSPEEKFDGSFETFVGANIDDTVNFIKNILEGSPNRNSLRHAAE